tara:strand:- start:410 stop:715 length:306 start_codon:yes stop_codon:yes gene_type:complete
MEVKNKEVENKEVEHKVLETENSILQLEIQRLTKELDFMNKIFEHPSSLVYHMERFNVKDKPIWIDTHLVTIQELQKLDQNQKVQELINYKQSSRYDDNDW